MNSPAETRRACEIAQVQKLRARGVPDPQNVVAEIAGGLRLCKTEAFCRKLSRSVDTVSGKVASAAANRALPKDGEAGPPGAGPCEPLGRREPEEPALRDRVMALLAEVAQVRGRRSA